MLDTPQGNDQRVSGLSIEHKLPLIIGALLVTVIVVISTAAYIEMKRTSLNGASTRLASITKQFRDLFQQSGAQFRSQVTSTARKPLVARFAGSRDMRLRDSAQAAMVYAGPQQDQTIGTQLRDSANTVLLNTLPASAGVDTMSIADITSGLSSGSDSVVVGHFRLVRDTLVYPVAARVANAGGAYVVHWRRLAGSRRGRELLNQLVGSDAAIFLGNADFSHWTDLEHVISAPPIDPGGRHVLQEYRQPGTGEVRLAMFDQVPGLPWVVAAEIPLNAVLAPVTAFLRRIAIIAAIALALGLLAAWVASRRITGPLLQLTNAADAIAHGQQTDIVPIDRTDELGRLGLAFATMASEVQTARTELERKVDDRTRDLNATMQQLQDAQDSLVRREKLAMLGQLASGVGHELRNPLGVMTNAVYYLKMVLTTAPQNVHEYLDILQAQITLSEKIVSDLLDFARLRAPQREAASLERVTQAQIARLGATDGKQIDVSIPADLPKVMVDEVQMGQILLNLLTNAMQAIEGPGHITVRAASSDGQVHCDVTDSGTGIRAENMEKIFEPLFTTKARGIGLGLAVSRTLARANGGDLSAISPPGSGRNIPFDTRDSNGGSRMTPRALVVDDDQSMVRTLRDILTMSGWAVTTASSGDAAVEQVSASAFDVVLMDVKMPGMNGVAAFKAMKAMRPNIRVVLMTAYAEPELLAEAKDQGAVRIMPKPVDLKALLGVIAAQLEQRRPVLLVDHDATFLKTLSDVLRLRGIETVVADNLAEATRLLEARHPTAVLLHMHLASVPPETAVYAVHAADPATALIIYSGLAGAEEELEQGIPDQWIHAYLQNPSPLMT